VGNILVFFPVVKLNYYAHFKSPITAVVDDPKKAKEQ
jgi:hypothetical protein